MAIQPTSKYLMADYRNSLGTNDAPQMIDTEIPVTPVAIVNLGLPKPRANQELKTYLLTQAGATALIDTQISSVNNNKKVYFVGANIWMNLAGQEVRIGDQTTGNISITTGSTTTFLYTNGANTDKTMFPSLPVECKQGLRLSVQSAAGGTVYVIIYYIEETVN